MKTTLALCFSGFQLESEAKIISEIIICCKNHNINLLLFYSLMLKGDFPKGIDLDANLVRGESEIFNLINYKMIDGLFVLGNSIYREKTVLELEKNCEKNHIPVININDPTHHFKHNVTIRNTFAMELIMEHLIQVHHCKKINFIGGYEDNKESIERLDAYKKILSKYNIPIEEKRIAYGHFWKQSIECAKKFVEDGLPEAIVCANDTMAIFVCDYLKNQGFVIPDDVIVTGFDGTTDAHAYEPSLTTVSSDLVGSGKKAYELMMNLLAGNQTEDDVCVDSELIVQESCGCRKIEKQQVYNFIDKKYLRQFTVTTFNQAMVKANIYFSDDDDPKSLFEHISSPLDLFGFKKFFFCIDANIESKDDYFFSQKNTRKGMPPKVTSIIPHSDFFMKESFPSKDLLWYDFLNTDESVHMCITPLYFRDRTLGYIVYEMNDFLTFDAELFQLWFFDACGKIGSFYLKRELEKLNVKDHLTGLYNRRGMQKYFEQVSKTAIPNEEYISVVCVDIDNLKLINDRFGHEGGDNAIIQSSNAIKYAFSRNSICVRTGGDEFCILTHSNKRPNVEKNIAKLDSYLENYNQTSNLEYKIWCSCGYFTLDSKDFTSFEEMQKIADTKLYEVKQIHHSEKR
ncbi:MAG: GGDEF domain-containing protein [Treponema sp.]|nr:GGDEF domain-containing protein [Treponema sp.]